MAPLTLVVELRVAPVRLEAMEETVRSVAVLQLVLLALDRSKLEPARLQPVQLTPCSALASVKSHLSRLAPTPGLQEPLSKQLPGGVAWAFVLRPLPLLRLLP